MKKLPQPSSQPTSQTMTAAPIPNEKSLTPAQQIALAAGTTIKTICKKAGIGERHFSNLARNGDACSFTAATLAAICKCPEMVFLWGLPAYQRFERNNEGAGGTRNFQPEVITAERSTTVAGRLRRNHYPALTKI